MLYILIVYELGISNGRHFAFRCIEAPKIASRPLAQVCPAVSHMRSGIISTRPDAGDDKDIYHRAFSLCRPPQPLSPEQNF
jgi:hypothetical protein